MHDFQGKTLVLTGANIVLTDLDDADLLAFADTPDECVRRVALLSFTRSMARELGPKTRVNAVSPGVIATPTTVDLIACRGAESIEQPPLRRLGDPSEIASVIGFLFSSAASFITGEVIHVNGGLYIAG